MFNIRPAVTAIAAVLALSSTPLLAQVAEEPVTTAPTPEAQAPAAADPLAPEPVAETPAAKPAAAAPTRTTRARATAKATSARSAPRTTAARTTVAAPPAASAAPTAEPMTEQPVPTEPVIAAPAPPPAAVPAAQPTAVDAFLASDEALPIAGAAGLGILALAGAGLVARRRRRRREAEDAGWQAYAETTPAAVAEPGHIPEPQRATMEPTFVRAFSDAPAAAPIAEPAIAEPTLGEPAEPIEGPTTDLPKGFDLSKFGPHVQAAYKGPTEDNPSLSLKYRLRRAAALDQMARKAGTAPAAARPAEAPAPRPAADQANGEFLLRRAATRPRVKPAYSE